MRITNFRIRVKVSNVMTGARFDVDISRTWALAGVQFWCFPSIAWLGLITAALTCCCDQMRLSG